MAKRKYKRNTVTSAESAEANARELGFDPPYISGSSRPEMRKPVNEQMVEGRLNAEWFVEMRGIYNDFNRDYWNYYGAQWPDFNEAMDMLLRMSDQCGLDLSKYAPEKMSLSDIQSKDDLFSMSERELEKIEQQILRAADDGIGCIDSVKKKRWVSIIRRLSAVRRMCRRKGVEKSEIKALWPGWEGVRKRNLDEVWECLHPIRFALWCDRSTLNTEDGKPDVLDVPPHFVRMCMSVTLAKKYREEHGFKGAVVVVPPGHGKTLLIINMEAQEICEEPWSPSAFVHNKRDEARKRLSAVRRYFDLSDDRGKRCRALYPEIVIDKRKDNADLFFVTKDGKRMNTHEEGCLNAYGMHTKATGVSLFRAKFDDPADEKEGVESGTRDRTNRAFTQTWLQRLRGSNTFFVMITTRWHPHDIVGVIRKANMKVAYCSIECGGPESDFDPIWPEVGYDRKYLKGRYYLYGPGGYSCIFQNNPDSEQTRRVTNLVYYDYEMMREKMSPEFKEFFDRKETDWCISLDPAGTDKKTSTLAGVLEGAFGQLMVNGKYRPTLVLVDRKSMLASQHKLAEHTYSRFTDHVSKGRDAIVLVETQSGYHATADMLTKDWGLPQTKIIKRPPKGTNKAARLSRYSLHFEIGDVLVPGRWVKDDSGKERLTVHPEWVEFADQILHAGTTKDTEMLDCMSQMVAEYAHQMASGRTMSGDDVESRYDENDMMHRFYKTKVLRKKKKRPGFGRVLQRKLSGAMVQ